MNSRKTLFIAFLLIITAGISSNLLAQQKTVHVKVVTNGKSADSVYTFTYTEDSKNNRNPQIVSVMHTDIRKNSVNHPDSIIEVEIVTSGIDEKEMETIPLISSMDTTIMHVSHQGDTIKIHRKVLKDGKIEQEVTVNKHSKDTTDNKYFTYRVRSDKNHLFLRKMRIQGEDDENSEFIMPPMPPSPPGIEGMNFDFPGMPEGIDENADFGKIKVVPIVGKNLIRVSLDLSGKENTVIKINDEKGKVVFEEKIKDLTGKYIRDIDMTGNEKGKYSLGIERGKSSITKQFTF
jgi:hypothetical protein